MRISTRIVLGLTVMVALVLSSSLYTWQVTSRLTGVVERLLQSDLPDLSRLDRLQSLITLLHTFETRILAENEPEDHRQFVELARETQLLIDEIQPPAQTSAEVVREFKAQAQKLVHDEEEAIRLQDQDDLFMSRQVATECMAERLTVLHRLDDLQTTSRYFLQDKVQSNQRLAQELAEASLAFALISIAIAVVLAWTGVRTLLAPLRQLVRVTQDVSMGNLNREARENTGDEFGQLGQAFNAMVRNLRHRIEEVAQANRVLEESRQIFQDQLRLAQQVQRSLVPRQPQVMGLDVFGRIQPAQRIGGDFYDVHSVNLAEGRIGLVMGDASGHGIAAALMMVMTVTIMREASRQGLNPAEILERVNRGLREQFPEETIDMFVTSAYVQLDLAAGVAHFAVAGHEPPFLWRQRDRSIQPLEADGLLLACFDEAAWENREVEVERGDKIVLYTDGLTEARDAEGRFFGRERLAALIAAEGHRSASELVAHVFDQISAFRGEGAPQDDIALLVATIGETSA